ncbi:hypothetical protein ACE6H2_013832 [Prunus campanulata]
MAFHYCLLGVLMPLSLLIAQAAAITKGPQLALPNCPYYHCGNLIIPYPFGMGEGCYLRPEFNITCNLSTQPPSAYWTGGTNRITNFSVADGELQIMLDVAMECYDDYGRETEYNSLLLQLPPPYSMSHTQNNFTTVGCDTIGIFLGERSGEEKAEVGNSVTLCGDILGEALPDSCSGIGCSQASIPGGLRNISTFLQSVTDNRTAIDNLWYAKYPCSYAFIVEQGNFSFNPNTTFQELKNSRKLPAVLNWAVEGESCDAAQQNPKSPCKENSKCVERTTIGGPPAYICQCSSGYRGNPYLPDSCQDIDECKDSNPCSIGTCINLPGGYSCKCPKGYKNDGMNQKSCIKHHPSNRWKIILLAVISLGVSAGLFVLLIGISWIYWGIHRRRLMKLKEEYFKENGGLLLQQQLASQGSSMETTKIFAAEELEKATDNYHESRVVGEGGYGIVYKGILADKKVVAIKKSKVGVPAQNEQFVNEVIVLSQINHRNVVRLLGCCLETPVPLLVYEYITNGTLFHHIHGKKSEGSSLSWELRLKIAAETAGALAYLHSSTSTPIIHRDVKAMNILLDDNYTAKVSDFGASRLVPMDQTQVTTLVQGTLGYLDPEYFHSNQLTQKSDVYSFGVVLVELLTSKVALSFARPESERNLASFFVCSMEEDGLNRIWDDTLFSEGNIQTLKNVANLAKRCVSLKGEERPTMKEVASELEGMRIMAKHPWESSNFCPEETVHLLGSPSNTNAVDVPGDCGSSTTGAGATYGHDSMQIEMLMPYDDGR